MQTHSAPKQQSDYLLKIDNHYISLFGQMCNRKYISSQSHIYLSTSMKTSLSVPPVQTVKGLSRHKRATRFSFHVPLDSLVFCRGITPLETGNRIKNPTPHFCLLYFTAKSILLVRRLALVFAGRCVPHLSQRTV